MNNSNPTTQIFALIDCNNFFVSCERIFRPDLEGKPVVVLSSNDGCAVARSNEAKVLGIPMGAPAFQFREVFEKHNVIKFSANFELYGDISRRITEILRQVTPRIEVYSVDESFLDLSELPIQNLDQWGRVVRARILREVGVPVSIGIAPSKTLCKIATERAKLAPEFGGVCNLIGRSETVINQELAAVPIKDVWGVGRRLAPKLRAEGVANALQLKQLFPRRAQQLMGIHGRQMVEELCGRACIQLEQLDKARKSISRGRTFGEDTGQAYVLEAAIAALTAQAAFRLREDRLLAKTIGLFVSTNFHKPGYTNWERNVRLDTPTNDTGRIINLLAKELGSFYSERQSYHRLLIWLDDLVPESSLQTDLFGFVDIPQTTASSRRMRALDAINHRFGRGKLRYAAEDLSKSWQPKHNLRSPRYVSNWAELPSATIYTA